MKRRSVLGILVIPLLVACGFGQQYFPSVVQHDVPGGLYSQPLPPRSLDTPVPAFYAAQTKPYGPTYPATSSPTNSYAATPPQYTASLTMVPPPYDPSYANPYAAPYTTPYASTPPQLAAPDLTPQIDAPTPSAEQSETVEPPEEETAEEAIEEPTVVEDEAPKTWYNAPVYWFDLWEGNVEIGLSGSEGNSETLNYLLGLDAKRETDRHVLDFDVKYDRKTANSIETAHRLFGEIRWELLFEDSCWTWFFHETTEYDEFTAYDVRLSYDTGLGRCLIKNDNTSLLARAGAGLSHELGSPTEDFIPEAVFGLEFDHKLNERQKLSASSEYSPDVTDFLDYRLKTKASWEVLLDEDTNLSLKVSVLDRYDSTPNGKKANDLDYTLTLLWSF